MMKPIVQCVPNFSEGRDRERIETIIEPLREQKGFTLVSYEPDPDYNRTVVTLIGDPEAMQKPLLKFVDRAVELIDMNQHKGEHPRMGAVDVMPFIPIRDIDMDACVELAHDMASRIADQFALPVFTYGEAARENKRKRLPNIRKGEFEGMHEKIQEEGWHPDYGQPSLHRTAGATAVGARLPLIAYNIDLKTEDMDIAKRLARAIRGSSGGFRHIQAGPVYLEERGHAQVTMNILNYQKNPIYRILETVRMEAARYGVEAPTSEVVGLLPREAVDRSLAYYYERDNRTWTADVPLEKTVEAARETLGFRDFDASKIIEYHIEEG